MDEFGKSDILEPVPSLNAVEVVLPQYLRVSLPTEMMIIHSMRSAHHLLYSSLPCGDYNDSKPRAQRCQSCEFGVNLLALQVSITGVTTDTVLLRRSVYCDCAVSELCSAFQVSCDRGEKVRRVTTFSMRVK